MVMVLSCCSFFPRMAVSCVCVFCSQILSLRAKQVRSFKHLSCLSLFLSLSLVLSWISSSSSSSVQDVKGWALLRWIFSSAEHTVSKVCTEILEMFFFCFCFVVRELKRIGVLIFLSVCVRTHLAKRTRERIVRLIFFLDCVWLCLNYYK